jgi:hypothetical protein
MPSLESTGKFARALIAQYLVAVTGSMVIRFFLEAKFERPESLYLYPGMACGGLLFGALVSERIHHGCAIRLGDRFDMDGIRSLHSC